MNRIIKPLNEMNETSVHMIRRGLFLAIALISGALLYAVSKGTSPYFSFSFVKLAEGIINVALSLFAIPLAGGLLLDYIFKQNK